MCAMAVWGSEFGDAPQNDPLHLRGWHLSQDPLQLGVVMIDLSRAPCNSVLAQGCMDIASFYAGSQLSPSLQSGRRGGAARRMRRNFSGTIYSSR